MFFACGIWCLALVSSASPSSQQTKRQLNTISQRRFPSRILHGLSAEIAEMIPFICQRSFDTGSLPSDWSVAMGAPVFNKDKRDNPANQRQIPLTSLVCRTMEHLVLSHIYKFLSKQYHHESPTRFPSRILVQSPAHFHHA